MKSNFKKIHFDNANKILTIHCWIPRKISAVVFYFHGIQSHAGWQKGLGQYLNSKSIALCVLDRRGSGESEGDRGDFISADLLLHEYYKAFLIIKNEFLNAPLVMLGQSFGGSILAAFSVQHHTLIQNQPIVFLSPSLGQRHFREKQPVFSKEGFLTLNFLDEDYTSTKKFLSFIKNDPLCIRKISKASYNAMYELEKIYINSVGKLENNPTAMIYPIEDTIIDSSCSIKIFSKLTLDSGFVFRFPAKKHYLEFSDKHHFLFSWLENYILTDGYRKSI